MNWEGFLAVLILVAGVFCVGVMTGLYLGVTWQEEDRPEDDERVKRMLEAGK